MITVTGEGRVSVPPNRAVITLGVMTENRNLSAAQQDNNETMMNVIQSLVRLGIDRENIKTVEYRIDTEYDYVEGRQVFRGYKVTHILQVTTDRVASGGSIVDTAVAHGANEVTGVQFTVSDPEDTYNQALSTALLNAVEKAEVLAQTMDVAIIPVPLDVEELSTLPPRPFAGVTLSARSVPTPIEPGQLDITASVRAKFHYH